jgi:hypothetical protein
MRFIIMHSSIDIAGKEVFVSIVQICQGCLTGLPCIKIIGHRNDPDSGKEALALIK